MYCAVRPDTLFQCPTFIPYYVLYTDPSKHPIALPKETLNTSYTTITLITQGTLQRRLPARRPTSDRVLCFSCPGASLVPRHASPASIPRACSPILEQRRSLKPQRVFCRLRARVSQSESDGLELAFVQNKEKLWLVAMHAPNRAAVRSLRQLPIFCS